MNSVGDVGSLSIDLERTMQLECMILPKGG